MNATLKTPATMVHLGGMVYNRRLQARRGRADTIRSIRYKPLTKKNTL